ncbi:MAG TPA: transporter substrate-binding domain-containing protein [Alphaproteobacteria bacterium]
MKPVRVVLVSAVTALIISCAVVSFKLPSAKTNGHTTSAVGDTSAYDHVMTSKTIRCGYVVWPPYLDKDVNTGKISGLYHDYMEEFGRAFGLNVKWTEEISISDIASALDTGRIDAFCLPLGTAPARTLTMNFPRPIIYYPFYAYVRADDKRFDNDLGLINDPGVTLSTMEGEYTSILARTTYPKAKILEITNIQGSSTLFLNVQNKKADVIFQDPGAFSSYNKQNPGVLRQAGGMVGAVAGAFPLKLGDAKIQRLFDYGIADLQDRFITERLLRQYKFLGDADEDALLYMPTSGYRAPAIQPVSAE